MWFGLSKRLCQSTQCSVRTCNIMQPDFPRYWQDGPILNIISENNLSICASGVGRHGFALIISNHHVILAQVPWSKIAQFLLVLGLGGIVEWLRNPFDILGVEWPPPGYMTILLGRSMTKLSVLRATGGTLACRPMHWCFSSRSDRPGFRGSQLVKWCARTRHAGAAVTLRATGPSLRLGIVAMSSPMRCWIPWLFRGSTPGKQLSSATWRKPGIEGAPPIRP
jgi:hypothetical protein